MRISTIQAFNNGVSGLQRNYANATRTQEQISTGNRILTPADDPVASVRLLQLEQQQNVLAQYNSNLTAAQNSLNQEESTLNSVNTVLQRVRELTVQAGNGALSQHDRQSIAAELGEREDELLGLMNTRNARGEYLFSGFQGKTQPFLRSADGSYVYQGDDGQRKLQVASSLQLPISDSGRAVFESATNAARLTVTGTPAGTISGALVDDEVSFASFPQYGVQIDIDAADPSRYTISKITTPADPITTPPTPAVLDATSAVTGQLIQDKDNLLHYNGTAFYVNGVPPAGSTFTVLPPDSDPSTAPATKVGILNTIATLRKALEDGVDSPQGNRDVRDAIALGLTNIDNGMTTVDLTRGQIGARLNVVDSTMADNEDVTLVNKGVQADLRELDYAEALSRLSFQQIILQAAQQSYVKISGLNLFNYLG
ncbi:flagellar hook-associated protein FlgL [Pseudomonas sp. LS44]|uniref:flagellar hook-associated protein FlgL n=1 Tax=Pseudomonas sp. LS44 TaxID=1357074 RepID=UPI00215B5C0D|nr:flagellar hook-associated protein FlgL [Pseudomonas sp. LS44]UVE16386.1 flagellar hook-associated protein FlgL [Pseudomonas sp. LS44]